MFLIRQGGPNDFSGVYPLAKLLDSYNLPADRGYIRELLEISARSFDGRIQKSRARYLFVLEDLNKRKIVGCSLIIAKHGTLGKPHLWLALETVTKRSRTLGLKRSHPVLRLGFTVNGPTEVGGLVVSPGYRRHPQACGLQISFVRFLYMAMYPERFEQKILVEYRGAMGAGNESPFWEAMGKVFTGLAYGKADRLSVIHKEFILNLFPREPIYCALLPKSVQEAIGAIHPAAKRAAGLLKSIGFRPLPQIEPFDGGPYYSARRREIRLVRQTRRGRVSPSPFPSPLRGEGGVRAGFYLVGTQTGGFFRAALGRGTLANQRWVLSQEVLKTLNVRVGDWVYGCPVSR